jgi:hypothetical protein
MIRQREGAALYAGRDDFLRLDQLKELIFPRASKDSYPG